MKTQPDETKSIYTQLSSKLNEASKLNDYFRRLWLEVDFDNALFESDDPIMQKYWQEQEQKIQEWYDSVSDLLKELNDKNYLFHFQRPAFPDDIEHQLLTTHSRTHLKINATI